MGDFAAPKPKNISLVCCARNPEPIRRMRLWRPDSVSTVILAPMASRLLSLPERRKEMTGGSSGSTFFRYRNCGLLRFFKTTSNRPSWSKSPRANVRLSSKKSSPQIPETSEKVPSRCFRNLRTGLFGRQPDVCPRRFRPGWPVGSCLEESQQSAVTIPEECASRTTPRHLFSPFWQGEQSRRHWSQDHGGDGIGPPEPHPPNWFRVPRATHQRDVFWFGSCEVARSSHNSMAQRTLPKGARLANQPPDLGERRAAAIANGAFRQTLELAGNRDSSLHQ